VEEHPLIGLGNPQNVTYFRGGNIFDVAEKNNLSLLLRKRLECPFQNLDQLATLEHGGGIIEVPWCGTLLPQADSTTAGFPLDARSVRREVRMRHDTTLPHLAGAHGSCAPNEDAKDPGAKRRAALKPAEAADHGEPGLLNDVLS